ncbi:hypothetical protein N7470_004783 [Penicillium chermesinum]|nr:hypothetical protein N7470_004783 [Penicillium chermesinum]
MQHQQSVLDRLDRIEKALGINLEGTESPRRLLELSIDEKDEQSPSLHMKEVWASTAHLRHITFPKQDDKIWARPIVKRLWNSFLNNLPLLHFLKDKDIFAAPTPLLLASVLYIAALNHKSAELVSLAPGYFAAIYCAITELICPPPIAQNITTSVIPEQGKPIHDILGLIMASLSSEGYIHTTGSWIATGYRLWLDSCPRDLESSSSDWRGLWSGLQVIDIEHASIHMSYPLLPRQPPIEAIRNLNARQGNAYQGLAEMMHFGLNHFVGRGLPTIWDSINADVSHTVLSVRSAFTEEDSEVIRLWARKLDDWLVRYNGTSQPTPSDRQGILILLQYHLHKLYVLSIYHPARGFDISSANITPVERHELLVSARAVLRLREDDASIWSNWDLIMITWAAVLLLRGIEDGMTHQDDLHLIRGHLQSLERSHPSTASIHTVLFQRLDSSMQSMHTPPGTNAEVMLPGPDADDSWTIFDQEIMALANPPWLYEEAAPFQRTDNDTGLLVEAGQNFTAGIAWTRTG